MSSSTDENIELLEITSPSSTKSYLKTKFKIADNKVGSPPTSSPAHSNSKTNSLNLFNPKGKPPKPKPRKLSSTAIKKHKHKLSRTATDVTSESLETSNSIKEKHDDFTESIFSSKSDTRSYREKFRERFESVKKQAGKSASKAHTLRTNTENIKSLKRNLNLIKKENEEIENVLQNYQKNKVQRDEESDSVSKIEAYHFFCEENKEDSDEEKQEVDLKNFGKSTDVLIAVTDKDIDNELVHFVPADNLHFNMRLSENELYWKPPRNSPKTSEKIESEEPRLLAEEGFFVEEKPKLPSSHLAILEQRLLSIDEKKWFNCEGELDLLPNPAIETSYKPHLYKQVNKDLETEYISATIDAVSNEDIFIPHSNILDISILSIKLKHHPLFSSEHVLEQKLITLYDLYKQRLNGNKLERIGKRLDALRNVKRNIEMTVNNNSEINLKKLEDCIHSIKKLRELHFEEGRQIREILKSILQTWKNIKKIRQMNGYSNTAIKLNIRKEKCSYEQERKVWDANIEETCNEIVSELELELQKKMLNYKIELEQWKSEVGDQEHLEEEIPKKPKKPGKSIDHDIIEQEVNDKFRECVKPPGEPILHFNLSYDNEITKKVENSKEKLRRNVVATTKIYLRLVCNKIEVCKSKIVPLTEKFTCFIDESFSIQLSTIPEYLIIEVHEQPSTLLKRKLGEIKVPIPPKNITMTQSKIKEEYFEKDEIVHYKHEGVGSGIEFKEIFPDNGDEDGRIVYTSGIIICKAGWDISTVDAHTFEETSELEVVQDLLNEDGTINVKKLMEWANDNNPDPQDPKNSVLYEYIKNYEEDIGIIQNSTKSYFRCNPEMAPFEFCEAKDIEENLRFKVLELRNRNEPEFVGMVIPNRLKEIPIDILSDYNRRCKEEGKNLTEDDFDYDEDEIDSKRIHGRKYLKQVYTKVFQQCRNAENNLIYEDVVNEKLLPHIESLTKNIISNILSWFQFQPTINILMPKPTRKTVTKLTDFNTSVRIKINIKSAMNVPLRNSVRSIKSISNENTEETTVKPFVVATYQNVSLQTAIVDGTDPVYNEELILPLETANIDYLSPNSLSGSIIIQLFDEITVTTRNGNAKARNWLGSVEIPVSAIAYNNKMEGLFKIRKPTNLLGYEHEVDDNYSNTRMSNAHQTTVQHIYLSLKLTLQPNIPKLTQSMDELETTELPYIKQHILNWNEAYNNEYPNRKFSALAVDINGKTTCVTRYIRPLEPPQLNSDRFDVSAEQCARYVSMIPFTDSNKFYQNVWLSTEQLLKLMIGSVIDHAIALTCYLTSLDLETWLLVGYGLPHGSTAYVLIREYNRESQIPLHFIYDVVTATKYDIVDVLCPLQRIFCVINEQNVWGNIQRTDQIQLTRFDFMRRSDWLPLFTNQVSAPTNSAQQKLIYSVTPDIRQLEARLDKKIRKKISKLRKHERTVWNHQLSRAFKSTVIKNETGSMIGRRNSELYPEIRNFTLTNFINGYIINMLYTTISTILTTIVATGVHLYEGVDTEFGLAVNIYPYPNHVLAVWICFAAITNRQSDF